MNDITFRLARTGDIDWIVDQHATLYARDDGFDDSFGPFVRTILEELFKSRDTEKEAGWIAEHAGQPLGCIFCVGLTKETAKLRMFLTVPEARGMGLGKQFFKLCTDFARDSGYEDMTLWTHESHQAACALYARSGWELCDSINTHSFGRDLVEQTWKRRL